MSNLTSLPHVEIGFSRGHGVHEERSLFLGGINAGARGFLPEGRFSKVGDHCVEARWRFFKARCYYIDELLAGVSWSAILDFCDVASRDDVT